MDNTFPPDPRYVVGRFNRNLNPRLDLTVPAGTGVRAGFVLFWSALWALIRRRPVTLSIANESAQFSTMADFIRPDDHRLRERLNLPRL